MILPIREKSDHFILIQFRWIYDTNEQCNQTVSNNSDVIAIISSGTLIFPSSMFKHMILQQMVQIWFIRRFYDHQLRY